MSKQSILLVVAMVVVGAFMFYNYDKKYSIVKGITGKKPAAAAPKHSVPPETDSITQANNDNNNIDQIINASGKSSQTASKGTQKPQVSREQFVAFDEWPSASNTDSNKPDEIPAQDVNQEQQLKNNDNNGQNLSELTNPQSVLDEELKSTSELYKGLANQLNKQGLVAVTYNARIRNLQTEYDGKIKILFRKKQKLDAIQKFIDNGSLAQEEGKIAMWRVVMPEEAIRAMSSKPKAPQKERPVAPPDYGTVTGILYNNETPLVMIDGEIYREGSTIRGVRITKIHGSSVEFEYKGFKWTQNVNDSPSPNWP